MIAENKFAMDELNTRGRADMNHIKKTEFSDDSDDRNIYLFGIIDIDTLTKCINRLIYLESIDSTREITIYINAFGDDFMNGFAIYDYIDSMHTNVKTICIGKAENSAAIVFLAGRERIMSKHSVIEITDNFKHNMALSVYKIDEIENIMERLDQLSNMISEVILDNSKLGMFEVCDMLNSNGAFFTQSDAEKAGIITAKLHNTERSKPHQRS